MKYGFIRKLIASVLNIPYTFVGLLMGLVLIPNGFSFDKNHFAIIIRVRKSYRLLPYMNRWRGLALGNVVILNSRELPNDLEHELIHVEQNNHYPFLMHWMNLIELLRKGYKNNRYEIEAYTRSNSIYFGESTNVPDQVP